MHDHSSGLVDHGNVRVFVEDVERNRFGFHSRRRRWRNLDGNVFARLNAMRCAARSAVHLHAPLVYQRLNARAAQLGQLRDEKEIEAPACVLRGNNEFAVSGGIHLR